MAKPPVQPEVWFATREEYGAVYAVWPAGALLRPEGQIPLVYVAYDNLRQPPYQEKRIQFFDSREDAMAAWGAWPSPEPKE